MLDIQHSLFLSARLGDALKLRSALDAGADPRLTGRHGMTPLLMASERGSAECIEILMPLSDLNATTQDGFTALMLAAERGNARSAKAFLAAGADPSRVDDHGHNALMLAAREGHPSCVELLLPVSDLSLRNSQGFTALNIASFAENEEDATAFKLLLPRSDPRALDTRGWSPLMLAASTGLEAAVKALLPVSDLLAKDPETGRTPLMIACANGHAACVRALLPTGNPLWKDDAGRTALMIACEKMHPDCVAALIPASDLLAKDAYGKTALSFAKSSAGMRPEGPQTVELLFAAEDAARLRSALQESLPTPKAAKPRAL